MSASVAGFGALVVAQEGAGTAQPVSLAGALPSQGVPIGSGSPMPAVATPLAAEVSPEEGSATLPGLPLGAPGERAGAMAETQVQPQPSPSAAKGETPSPPLVQAPLVEQGQPVMAQAARPLAASSAGSETPPDKAADKRADKDVRNAEVADDAAAPQPAVTPQTPSSVPPMIAQAPPPSAGPMQQDASVAPQETAVSPQDGTPVKAKPQALAVPVARKRTTGETSAPDGSLASQDVAPPPPQALRDGPISPDARKPDEMASDRPSVPAHARTGLEVPPAPAGADAAGRSEGHDKGLPSPLLSQALAPAMGKPVGSPYPAVVQANAHAPVVQAQPGRMGADIGVQIAKAVKGEREDLLIRLDPREMGRIDVRLSFDRDGLLRAVMSADSPAALDMLRRESADLNRALTDAGVRADGQSLRFDARPGGQGSGDGQGGARGQSMPDRESRSANEGMGELADLPYRPLRASGHVDLMA